MDLKVIADAVAARFVNVVATNGTETETATATADLPNQVVKLALLVYPPTGDLGLIMGPKLDDHYIFPVRLLRDPLNVPSRSQWLYAWATAMRTRVQQNIDLDVAGVAEAQVTAMRAQIDGHTYGQGSAAALFDVVEVMVDVHVYELTTIG
jgi:hypothetical protein